MEYHEECQYPPRPYVNGQCDNTDPCDPTNIKEGGACTTTVQPNTPTELPRVGAHFEINWWVIFFIFVIGFIIIGMYNNNRKS